ncbi:hypothetical protein RIR_jg17831.t1 [Rhizophagus irregularis DAOM 181602=DAOM 197198]|nr:hypothetical protein RIR_jg17831.t1 [Rhizophagus irregularis DAOM 181602=DAOM 197198]
MQASNRSHESGTSGTNSSSGSSSPSSDSSLKENRNSREEKKHGGKTPKISNIKVKKKRRHIHYLLFNNQHVTMSKNLYKLYGLIHRKTFAT